MLRGLTRFLGTGVPVLGVNFGRVGFLDDDAGATSSSAASRASFAGDYRVIELPTLEVGAERRDAHGASTTPSSRAGRSGR